MTYTFGIADQKILNISNINELIGINFSYVDNKAQINSYETLTRCYKDQNIQVQ